MAEYDNNNEIAIWKNDNRETEKHPHYKGNGIVDGIDYWVSAWRAAEDAKPNSPVLKLRLTPKDKDAAPKAAPVKEADPSEDIPF
jgi:hypothetical protein